MRVCKFVHNVDYIFTNRDVLTRAHRLEVIICMVTMVIIKCMVNCLHKCKVYKDIPINCRDYNTQVSIHIVPIYRAVRIRMWNFSLIILYFPLC